jgi:hypothetical protein
MMYQEYLDNELEIVKKWHPDFGDRQNEIVIIGQDLDHELVTKELEECLCTQEEINLWKSGYEFNDPMPTLSGAPKK